MLRHLRVRELALIEDAVLELGPGMTVLTGETGAGKSLLMDAVALITGARANAAMVRSGCEKATVEALFEVAVPHPAVTILEELGIDAEEGDVVLRREVTAAGRSRAWINGSLVPLSRLAGVARHLVELHAQHDQHNLLDGAVQRELYDEFLGLAAERAEVAAAHRALLDALARREELRSADREREQRRDFVRFQIDELESLELSAGEAARLEAERLRLAHQADLQEGSAVAIALLTECDEHPPASETLARAIEAVEAMCCHDQQLDALLSQLRDAAQLIEDAGRDLVRYARALTDEPEDLDAITERLEALRRALRKHGPSEEEALVRLEEYRLELERLDNWEAACGEAEDAVSAAASRLEAAAGALSEARRRGAAKFAKPLATMLREFAMPKARVEVHFPPLHNGAEVAGRRCGAAGFEDVEIRFSANPGEPLRPLAAVASGGELSRIMLALRTLSANGPAAPLLVFDEVDAGISGAAARHVAERLAALGTRHQVLCVTHNPSVAAAGGAHFLVEKDIEKTRTTTSVVRAEGLGRLRELARLLDGGRRSAKGLELAAQLLDEAV